MTANNQYFERNMLINAQKTNTILESEDWGPQTTLSNINRFMDASAATVENQTKINDTLNTLLGENNDMENELLLLNEKLAYQNARPPGVGSDEVWLPTQLLMDIVRLQEEANEIQEESGSNKELEYLNDISNNTGAALDLLRDISKNTVVLIDLYTDNSKNLINLLNDVSGSNIDNSKNLIAIKTEIETVTNPSLLSIDGKIGTADLNNTNALDTIHNDLHNAVGVQPWLETVNTNLYNSLSFQPWLETVNTNLTTLNSQITTLESKAASFNAVKISYQKGSAGFSQDWTGGAAAAVAEGVWFYATTYPPKKITLFVKLSGPPASTDYVNFYGSFTGLGTEYYLHDRYTHDDFNPPIVEGDMPLALGIRTWSKVTPPVTWLLSRTYDWIGQFMKIEAVGTINILSCYARGI